MWRWRARMMMVKAAKKMRVWMKIAFPLVRKLPKSIGLCVPGSSKSSPGERSTNNTTPTTTGAQSAIFSFPSLGNPLEEGCWWIVGEFLIGGEGSCWRRRIVFGKAKEREWGRELVRGELIWVWTVKGTVRILIFAFRWRNGNGNGNGRTVDDRWRFTFLRVGPNILTYFDFSVDCYGTVQMWCD